MNVIEPKVIHDFQDVIRGSEVNTSVKLYQDAKGFYRMRYITIRRGMTNAQAI